MNDGFVFKGARDYLHSTTVFDWITGQLDGPLERIDFTFNRKTAMKCRLVPEASSVPGDDVVGKWKDAQNAFRIIETAQPIKRRQDYDEDSIGLACRFQQDLVFVPSNIAGTSLIERLVAAYKALLLHQDGIAGSKLAFVRLKLDRLPAAEITIRLVRRIGADFFQGEIAQDACKIGEIFFGRWK